MGKIVITNNEDVYLKYKNKLECVFSSDYSYRDILELTRAKIHRGHKLLTHPLSGSIKPNETPYKTIIISKEKGGLDYQSLEIIEESIISFNKFHKNKETPSWSEDILDDFRVIDSSLIHNAMKGIDKDPR